MVLQQELIQKANSKEDYDEIADEIFRLRELRQKTTIDTAARDEQIKRINELQVHFAANHLSYRIRGSTGAALDQADHNLG